MSSEPSPPLPPHSPNVPPSAPYRKGSGEGGVDQESTSLFLQNVDYSATQHELELIFEDCGPVLRVTFLKDPVTGKSKGCAYVQLSSEESVKHALLLSGTTLRKRNIKVSMKRKNIRGMNQGRGRGNEYMLSKLLSMHNRH